MGYLIQLKGESSYQDEERTATHNLLARNSSGKNRTREIKKMGYRIFDLIATEVSGVLICGGDWNAQLHPTLDSSNPKKKRTLSHCTLRK